MAGARVIQKMDQCGSAQVGICDLTGLCKLMIANLISLHLGVNCGGCEIHNVSVRGVQSAARTRKQL